ncbi:MAG: flavodoxin domain-containing protein [Beutenbergiaceae bacterium]
MRILIATASTHGCTRAFAELIGEVFTEVGHYVIHADVESQPSLDVDAVVLGSAVYGARPMAAGRQFGQRLEREFTGPTWAYAVGVKNITRDPLKTTFTEPRTGNPLEQRYPIFGGVINPDGLSIPEKALIGMLGAAGTDLRDEELVQGWALMVASRLAAQDHSLQS